MTTQPSAATGISAETHKAESVQTRPPRWHDSLWFVGAVSLLAGFLYALMVMGPTPLNPKNVNWIAFDPAYHYIGWELYRQDPHVHWPITHTDRLGYPKGESISLVDLNPLMAVVLKPFSALLPHPAQYFGIEVILCCALQFFFAFRLLQLLIGPNFVGAALGSCFFLLATPLNYRFWGHYSLSNQWLLIAALFVFARAQERTPNAVRRFFVCSILLAAISVGINPYLAFEVLMVLVAGVASLLWQKRITLAQSAGVVAVLGAVGFVVAYAFGLVISGGKGYASGGYRDLSMNLVAPFDPRTFNLLIFPRLRNTSPGQYEGYSYLGAGVIILAVVVVVLAFLHKGKLQRPDKRWVAPLAACCFLLTLMALSTKITGGDHTLLDLDPNEYFTKFFAPLRASGRFSGRPITRFLPRFSWPHSSWFARRGLTSSSPFCSSCNLPTRARCASGCG